jgi:hypothetical protein
MLSTRNSLCERQWRWVESQCIEEDEARKNKCEWGDYANTSKGRLRSRANPKARISHSPGWPPRIMAILSVHEQAATYEKQN